MVFGLGLPQPHSSICLIPLWLAALKRPSCVPGPHVGLGRERPPPKQGGHAVPHRWHLEHASVPAPMGSLTSSFIPAGRLGKTPLSPRASSCRIGPRRQGFASPLRALDGSGPIRKTRCLRGERGGVGPWGGPRAGRTLYPVASDLTSSPSNRVSSRAVRSRSCAVSGLRNRSRSSAIRLRSMLA